MRRAILTAAALGLLAPSAQAAEVDADAFRPYAAGLIDRLTIGTESLAGEVDAGDLEAAKSAWMAARVGWERGETFLGKYFPDADEAIDSWPDATSGFHAIEPLLFEAGDVAAPKVLSEGLMAEVEALRDSFAAQELGPEGLANGLAGIAYEIGEAKAGGGESRSPAPPSWTCATTWRASRHSTRSSSRARSRSGTRRCTGASWRA